MNYQLPHSSRRYLAIIGALLGASLHAAPSTDVQLLAKYDFESPAALKEWTGEYAGTYKAAISWQTPFSMELDHSNAHSGNGALLVDYIAETVTGSKAAIAPPIDVPAYSGRARTIIIRGFAKVTGAKDASIELRALQRDAGRKPTKWLDNTKTLATLTVASGWQEFQIEGEVLDDTRSLAVMFVNTASLSQGESASSLALDDLTVEMK